MTVSPLAPAAFPAMPDIKGVTLSTAASGMKYTGRDDMLLMRLDGSGSIAAVFTKSDTAAAPVQWCRQQLGAGGGARAILVNAGNANAFTGDGGMAAVTACCEGVAAKLGCAASEVLTASTGVIGEPLDSAVLADRFDDLVSGSTDWQAAAQAILTTDTFTKGASAAATIAGTDVQIAGIAKGSGMIAPDMATMLGYVFTDAAISPAFLQECLSRANRETFSCITVDSDTSTSDTVLAFATGKAGNAQLTSFDDPGADAFMAALRDVCRELAHLVVRDGEGAQKFIAVTVTGASDDESARRIGLSIANSPLVKTAVAGGDANWGRVVMAVGKAGEPADRDRLSIAFGGHWAARDGQPVADYDEAPVAKHLQGQEVDISVDLGLGEGRATVWTCDLTHGYISINADYRS